MNELPTGVRTPSTNGHYPAPPTTGGAVLTSPARAPRSAPTVFPPDVTQPSATLLLYWLGRAHLAGFSLLRWMWLGGALLALVWLAGLPGRHWVSAFILLAIVAVTAAHWLLARRSFVRFIEAAPPPTAPPAPLPPADKIPVHISGILEVGGRLRPFAWLPGFYRTFATREHALLCQCRERRVLGLGEWPDAETGLWYAFFKPDRTRSVRFGTLRSGRYRRPAIAVEYLPEPNPAIRKRRGVETLYIACEDEEMARRILADLAVETSAARPPHTRPREQGRA